MSKLFNFNREIETLETYYCILESSACEIVDINNETCGEFSYETISFPLDEKNSFVSKEELVASLSVGHDALYKEDDLPKLKEILSNLRENFSEDGEEFEIIKFTVKSYKYMAFDTVEE